MIAALRLEPECAPTTRVEDRYLHPGEIHLLPRQSKRNQRRQEKYSMTRPSPEVVRLSSPGLPKHLSALSSSYGGGGPDLPDAARQDPIEALAYE